MELKLVALNEKYEHKILKKAGVIMINVIADLKKETNEKVSIDARTSTMMNRANNYNDNKDHLERYPAVILDKRKTLKILPWVNIAIRNTKSLLLCVHHSIGIGYLLNYLDGYYYKFTRTIGYFESVFDTAIIAVMESKWKTSVQTTR